MHTNDNNITNSLHQRFHSLIWSCLDADLTRTAVFHAERYFYATNPTTPTPSSSSSSEEKEQEKDTNTTITTNNNTNHNHDARHLYATALIQEGQTYSALALVNGPKDEQCCGCLEIKARCCTLLGRHRQSREAIEEMLEGVEGNKSYVRNASSTSRIAHAFPEEAALRCKAGTTALKGNMPEKAAQSFRQALKLDPFLWEAFEGLCALGPTLELDELFPPRLPPVKRLPPEEYPVAAATTTTTTTTTGLPVTSRPIATGTGFFTPDTTNVNGVGMGGGGGGAGNLFRSFKHKPDVGVQPFRMAVSGPRDSIGTNDSFFYPDNSFHGLGQRNSRLQPPQSHHNHHQQQHQAPPTLSTSRPLSSADEAGPATKRLRSTATSVTSGGGGTSSQAVVEAPSPTSPGNTIPNPNTNTNMNTTGAGLTLRSKSSKVGLLSLDEPGQQQQNGGGSKKARLRPALSFANVFSYSSRTSSQQPPSSSQPSRIHMPNGHVNNNHHQNGRSNGALPVMRRSTRLQSGTVTATTLAAAGAAGAGVSNVKVQVGTKHATSRDRRRGVVGASNPHLQQLQLQQKGRHHNTNRSKSAESDRDEDMNSTLGPLPHSPSPNSNSHSRSQSSRSPSLPPLQPPPLQPPTWHAQAAAQAEEEYENEMAEYFIYELVRKFAGATRKLAMFDCKGCIEELEKLPWGQQKSCKVVAMVARAHYERQEYHAAERAFKTLRMIDPYRLWDMEIYSSLLWQLQKPIELSFLAQELLNISPRSASTWISIGNLFSLQKQRSQALRSFQRAYELDPGCAYAYTLSGHEWIDEDVERAIGFFQSALRADGRHYNAWYGLGTCYLRMGKWRMAEWHFGKAVDVCPGNAVLLGCVGMAVERRGEREKALNLFNEAVKIAADNALVRYRRAKIYISMERYQEALGDLEYLANATPEESNVIFQLAKVYRLVGDRVKSAQALASARDVSPKSVGKIRRLVEMEVGGSADESSLRMDES